MGDMVRTEIILRETTRKYDIYDVQPSCGCNNPFSFKSKREFLEVTYFKDIASGVRENTAFCVKFTPAEINCIPRELQYEMFRSTREDLLQRKKCEDYWMDWAVVDSSPYLYFLKYKTYGRLQRHADQQQALNNLMRIIRIESMVLRHKETALNLLGQCMEMENRIQDALFCYTSSLNVRKKNNAAKFHLCRLTANIVNRVEQ
jgi:hypothetical protein